MLPSVSPPALRSSGTVRPDILDRVVPDRGGGPLTTTSRTGLLGILVALLFAGGLLGLAVVSDDEEEDDVLSATSSTSSTAAAFATSTTLATTTSLFALPTTTQATVSTSGGSGLGAEGSATVTGSDETAETGAESLLLPGLGLLALGLGARRLRR